VDSDSDKGAGTVLVIDDSDISRGEMMRLLTNAGLEVVGLASPIGATRVILTTNVKVVVIDVLMPSMRGDRLAALFRGNPRMNAMGVVLVSGENASELSRLADDVQADAAVSKLNLAELVPAVKRAMAVREARSRPPFRNV
jgi:DNA-binding NarL/FixJ family response regulator